MKRQKKNTENIKGGAEKLRLKRAAELKAVGNDPKQKKISFISESSKKSMFIFYL